MDFDFKPITLLSGHRDNTARTGQGCFMDVVSYLNGDVIVTDSSLCVCPTIRPIVIVLNDKLDQKRRNELMLPFVLRAMGSAYRDPNSSAMVKLTRDWVRLQPRPIEEDEGDVTCLSEVFRYLDEAERNLRMGCFDCFGSAAHSIGWAIKHAFGVSTSYSDAVVKLCLHYLDEALPPLEQLPPPTVDVQSRYQALVDMARAGVKPVTA